jgi:hypothetical protein
MVTVLRPILDCDGRGVSSEIATTANDLAHIDTTSATIGDLGRVESVAVLVPDPQRRQESLPADSHGGVLSDSRAERDRVRKRLRYHADPAYRAAQNARRAENYRKAAARRVAASSAARG